MGSRGRPELFDHSLGILHYERTTERFKGPLSRAIEALRQPLNGTVSAAGFLRHLATTYPDMYCSLEWVRFHTFLTNKAPGLQMRVAVVSVMPRPAVRDGLFRARQAITNETGWYPLIQGSRIDTDRLLISALWEQRPLGTSLPRLQSVGQLLRVRAMANSDEQGICFVLEGTEGALQLDTGKELPRQLPAKTRGTILTHFHGDHSGGVWALTKTSPAPVLLSHGTLRSLWGLTDVPPQDKLALIHRARPFSGRRNYRFADGGSLELFPVFHTPGATGMRLMDRAGNLLVYFGDICLRNGFKDFRQEALDLVLHGPAQRRFLLLDATMAKRPQDPIDPNDTPREILKDVADGATSRNVFFLSSQPEALVYACLQAFYLTKSSNTKLLLSVPLQRALWSLMHPLLVKRRSSFDPVVLALTGGSYYSHFAESHRIYPLVPQVLLEIPADEPVVVFAQPSELTVLEGLTQRLRKSVVYLAGVIAQRLDLPHLLTASRPKAIFRVETPDWSFHSSDEDLAAYSRMLAEHGVCVGLFHSFPRNLRRFIKVYGLDSTVHVMADGPLEIGST